MASVNLQPNSENTVSLIVKKPSFLRIAWRVTYRKPTRLLGLFLIVFFILMAIVGPDLYPAVLPMDPTQIYGGPSWQHPLGTDYQGTDVLAEIVTGSRFVLYSAFLAALFTVVTGVVVGLAAGYFRGWLESVLMRIADFKLTVPGFPLLIVLSTVWKFSTPLQLALVLGLTSWPGLARAVRSQTLSLRERGFIESARGLGLSNWHIVVKEIFPNMAPYVLMNLMTAITGSIYSTVGMFYLGVLPFSTNNWGMMLNMAFSQSGAMYSTSGLLYLMSPLGCILLVTFGVVLFLDAVDEMFNPRLRGV